MKLRLVIAVCFIIAAVDIGFAQWIRYRDPRIPRAAEFRRPNVGTLQVQVTVNDPVTFSRAWNTQTISFRLLPDTDFIESICENEKDSKVISPQ